jgi:chromosome segregation ATPase
MNVDEKKIDHNLSDAGTAEIEQKLLTEKRNYEHEKELLHSEIDTLQVQVDYLRSSSTSMEKQVMELQGAMERLLRKQMDNEKKNSDGTSTAAKLRIDIGKLEQEKRTQEELFKQSAAVEKKQKQEISRLSDMLESYCDHNATLKNTVKSLNADIASLNQESSEMSKKMNLYGEKFEGFYKELKIQVEHMSLSANEREVLLEELLKKEKERNDSNLAEIQQLLKDIENNKLERVLADKNDMLLPKLLADKSNMLLPKLKQQPMKTILNPSMSEKFALP